LYVPVTTSVKELMKQLGCNNAEAKKNRLFELVESGAGRWLKGLEIGVSYSPSFTKLGHETRNQGEC
jgi:hypothetical protein